MIRFTKYASEPIRGGNQHHTATFDKNVLGVLLSLKHELRVMRPEGSGNIVIISSTPGERGVVASDKASFITGQILHVNGSTVSDPPQMSPGQESKP